MGFNSGFKGLKEVSCETELINSIINQTSVFYVGETLAKSVFPSIEPPG